MTTQEEIFGHWNQLKGKIRESWGQLTDDELEEVEGKFDQLVGLIQQKTGEGRQHIERTLRKLSDHLGDVATDATEGVRGRSAYPGARAGDQDGLVLKLFSLIHDSFCKRFLFSRPAGELSTAAR